MTAPKVPAVPESGALVIYENMCRALAEAIAVDEVMAIRDEAAQLVAAARIANNHQAEADAVAIRMRATRKLGQLMKAQEESVGLATGGEHGGRRRIDGSRTDPSIQRPTLAMQGIGKRLAHQARVLRAQPEEDFEKTVGDVHDKVARAVRNVVREIENEQEREDYRARTEDGCVIADLEALVAAGKKFGVICPDFPWRFEAYSRKGNQRSAERYYDTMPLAEIMAMAPLIAQLAAPDCALFLWGVCPELPGALEFIKAAGFTYKTVEFFWLKTTPNAEVITLDGKGLHWGMGKSTRSNIEPVLLATRGNPRRMANDVHQVIIAPVPEEKSEKPDEVYRRIQRLFPGPYLELFARRPREHWVCWGNEIPRADFPPTYDAHDDDIRESVAEGFEIIRERVAAGGPGRPRDD